MVNWSKNILVLASCGLSVAATFYLQAFGVWVLFAAPTYQGESFWRPEKFFYGLLPICVGLVLLLAAFRRLARLFARRRNVWIAACAIAILAVLLDAVCYLSLRTQPDDQVHIVWNQELGLFSWGTGEVRLPKGFTHAAERGIDTIMGKFRSADGKVIVTHDIGELAGEHGGMGNEETQTEGSRVRVGYATLTDPPGAAKHFARVSFPDSGCANFYSYSTDNDGTAIIQAISRSFRPTGRTPSFLRPLLPEILRSDCRYRIELPPSLMKVVDLLGDSLDRMIG